MEIVFSRNSAWIVCVFKRDAVEPGLWSSSLVNERGIRGNPGAGDSSMCV